MKLILQSSVCAAVTGIWGDFELLFLRGNVSFVLAATFRARLFLLPIAYSLFPIVYCLFPIPYSLLPIPYSLLPIAYSLLHLIRSSAIPQTPR